MSYGEDSREMSAPATPDLVVARLLDYFGRRTDWQRRLWNPGTVTVIEEVHEALKFMRTRHLTKETVNDLARTAKCRAGPDLGVGTKKVRSALTKALKTITALKTAPKDDLIRLKLEHLLTIIKPNYLARWSDALAEKPGVLTTEAASRLLAGHLLGLGFSPNNLHRWAIWLREQQAPNSLSEVFAEAEVVARRKPRVWQILIPFSSIKRHNQEMPDEWLDTKKVNKWLAQHAPHASIRQLGGFLLGIKALDAWAAVEEASDAVESLAARVAVGSPGAVHFMPLNQAFVADSRHEFKLGRPRRQVDIHSLKRQNALFSISGAAIEGRLRSALDLVAPLETGAPGSAVAGGWAAIEAILARPNTRNVQAAADLAVLIACSFPRAELTPLTYAYQDEHTDSLATGLSNETSNFRRCALLGKAIASGQQLAFARPSDQAAAKRVAEITANPRCILQRVADHVEEAIKRLYRQRNLVMHAGTTDSVAMEATLRTVPSLVGAGLDRLVHDALTTGKSEPLRLVARARTQLELCGSDGGTVAWDLLGH